MEKPKALVIESGNLLERKDVLDWLKIQQETYDLALFIGAGEQTNQAFNGVGYEIQFCPLGRVTKNIERKQLCKQIAKRNRDNRLAP
jgi:hypothetical protein